MNFLSIAMISLAVSAGLRGEDHRTTRDNVIWTTPSKDATGSMPLGNGELGINLWVEEDGDLLFYLSRNDSFSEISQLCKVGKVRVSLVPNPFVTGAPFHQELKLCDGVCEITAGKPDSQVKLKVFVDVSHPVVHVTCESAVPLSVTAKIESWRTEKQKVPGNGTAWTLNKGPMELWQSADVFPPARPDSVSWYHRNEASPAFEETVRIQSLEPIRGSMKDPLIHRTFGGWLIGTGFKSTDNRTLASSGQVKAFNLRVASPCSQTASARDWLVSAEQTAGKSPDATAALARTTSSWRSFWDRSWVLCDEGSRIRIPSNNHPVRLGVDSSGGSRFAGSIGETRIIGRPLTSQEISTNATGEPKIKTTPGINATDFKQGLTLEAWIKPEAKTSGRIFDKITVGGADGFLLDTHPGDSLRMIVGSTILQAPAGILKPGQWHHVAATCNPKTGDMEIHLDGKSVALPASAPQGSADTPRMSVGKAHTLQRYMQACAGRGIYPIKFNGSIFTVEPTRMGQGDNPDWRKWGDCHWWQNVRMPYHAMQAAGDFDLMMPLFDMFEAIRPFSEARAKLYHNSGGCYFAETMTVWGTYSNGDYGWDRTGHQPKDVLCPYWQFAWNQGLELVSLMLDYYDHTGDQAFLKSRLIPMAASVLTYFDTRFRKDADGRIVLDPTQSVETYWHGVINDTPTVAGLNDISTRLCALPESALATDQRAFFQQIKAAAPVIPIEDAILGGQPVRRIGVAQKYDPRRSNCENPELFPIWPFRIFGLQRPMLEEARNAYALRGSHNDVGWGYDGNAAALLGLTAEAERILLVKIANSNAAYRWPATWGPNFDWLPDQCHGGNLMASTHYMLLQHSGEKILLLPAWPKGWDVSFKLHAPHQTTIECVYRDGKIEKLEVLPPLRRNDIQLPAGLDAP
jgi:hypothetical protein